MKLSGKTYLVIGATGGIGSKITELLDEQHAKLILHTSQLDIFKPMTLVNDASYISSDLTCIAGIQMLTDFISSSHVLLDGIIFAAGLNDFKWLEDQDDNRVKKTIELNLLAPMLITKHLLPFLNRSNRSSLVYIGSTLGSIGLPGSSTYCATKFGLRGFVQALGRELKDSNISCLYIAPRATNTSMNADSVTKLNQALGNHIDSPEQVAQKVMYAIEKQKSETFIGWPEKLFVKINSLFPRILDFALSKQLIIYKKFAKE